ncbi:MAG: AAA family ATPase [Mycobacteriales bacterium]
MFVIISGLPGTGKSTIADAIVDAVSAIEIARDIWRQVAQRTGSELRIIEVVCSDELLHRQRLEARQREIEGFYEPTWEQVMARRVEYQPWLDQRLVLDSAEDLAENVKRALAYVRPTTASVLT